MLVLILKYFAYLIFLGWPGSTHLTRDPIIRPGRPPGQVSKLWVHLWCQSAREPIDGGNAVFGVEAYCGPYAIENVFSLIRFSLYNYVCSSSSFWPFKKPKQHRFTAMCIYIKKGWVSARFARVTHVPSQLGFAWPTPCTGFYLDLDRSQARVGQVPGRPTVPVRASKLKQSIWK